MLVVWLIEAILYHYRSIKKVTPLKIDLEYQWRNWCHLARPTTENKNSVMWLRKEVLKRMETSVWTYQLSHRRSFLAMPLKRESI